MIYSKRGEVVSIDEKDFVIGGRVKANDEDELYSGLTGTVLSIVTDEDMDTDNMGPDIYVCFDEPEDAEEIKNLEKIFSEAYEEPKTIDEIALDEVIMAASMLDIIEEA